MSKTNTGLVAYAKAQLGKPYWYGTFGNTSSYALYKSKKSQYPDNYRWDCKDNQPGTNPSKQLGVKVHDCVGLIKGYLWCDSAEGSPKYNSKQDVSANGMYSVCTRKGTITTMPEVPGVLVFMDHHVGVYIGDGYVIEAKGHKYGVVKTALKGRGWTKWGYCPYITYEEAPKKPTTQPTTKPSSSGKKTVAEIAKEVIEGKWGNGDERKKKLKAAGYDYNAVQKEVNKQLSSGTKKKSITEIAKEVIAGKWGNGATRKAKLEKAGYNYLEVQKEVNRLLK
ncbi:MAG: hypothetical protein E7571_08275 [Ruminococcaceae bacterium]|nr:hypothetical protein [Oscillospiraceae bacterium]